MKERASRLIMFAARGLYLLGIILFVVKGLYAAAIFNWIIFGGSLVILYFGRHDHRFFQLDAFITCVFVAALIISYFQLWNVDPTLYESILGFDKILHMAGGVGLATFAALAFRKHIKSKGLFFASIIVFALAVGAAWEVYEWLMTILPPPLYAPSGGYADSMLDLVADTLGATIVAIVLYVKKF